MYDDPKSKISELERVLDAREDLVTKKIKRHELHDRESNIKQDWEDNTMTVGHEVSPIVEREIPDRKNKSFSFKFLIGSIIFFVIALLAVIFNFFFGGNLVSGDNIEISVKAPISVAGGETFSFEIEIKNKNNVSLLGSDLGITFPSGARDINNTALPAKRAQEFLGEIRPGETVNKKMSALIFGGENEKKDLVITLEYKVTGSNSVFKKVKNLSIIIGSAPVSILVTHPSEINTNQSIDFTVEVISNSTSVIKNLLLKADYPFGFIFSKSSPQTFSDNNLWLIGDLEPGAKRVIKISGNLSGQEGEERGFTFSIGSQSNTDDRSIDVPFSSSFSSAVIRRPFVSADVFLNGSDSLEYVSRAGSKIETTIRWRNNLAYEVSDVSLVVKLSGNTLDKSSIQVTDGYYRSIDNSIIFNKSTDPSFARLEPGQTGENKFVFGSFSAGSVTGSSLINPTIVMDIYATGKRIDYSSGSEDVLFSDSRKVKITANPQLSAKALYYIGPFKNTGPIPPVAERETTYTITWTVTNPLNNLSNAQVSAVLPPYIKWQSLINPSRENISYDEGTGKVVWSIGNISPGAGSISPAKEVSFQISFLPSVDQINATPVLIGDAALTAKDNFTLTTVSDSFSSLNTRLGNDPYFKIGDDKVIQ